MNHQNTNTGDFNKLPTLQEMMQQIAKSENALQQVIDESVMLTLLGDKSFTVNLLHVYSLVLDQLKTLNYPEEVKSKAFWAWFKEIEEVVDILTGVDQGLWRVKNIDVQSNKLTFE